MNRYICVIKGVFSSNFSPVPFFCGKVLFHTLGEFALQYFGMTWFRRLNRSLVLSLSKVFKIDGLMSAEPLLLIFYVMRIGTEFIGR